jgi:hypothetical protein
MSKLSNRPDALTWVLDALVLSMGVAMVPFLAVVLCAL